MRCRWWSRSLAKDTGSQEIGVSRVIGVGLLPQYETLEDMKFLRTIILAAGKGTRFKSETPKVLHDLWGKPVIGHLLEFA